MDKNGGMTVRTAGLTMRPLALRQVLSDVRLRFDAALQVWAFLVGVCLCGLVFGAVVAGELNGNDIAVLGDAVQRVLTAIQQHQLASAHDLWWQRMVDDAQLLALVGLFGASVIGLPFVVIALFLRAFSIGFAVGFTVIQFGWKGWILAGVGIFLHQLLSMGVLLFAGVAAIRFSAALLQQTYPLPKLSLHFAKYALRISLCLIGLIPGALVQAYLTPHLLASLLIHH
jgi:stage II sporulation protein M